MRILREHEGASGAVVAFAVVLVIFTTALAAFLAVVQAPAFADRDHAPLDGIASSGLVDVLDTAGYYVDGGTRARTWTAAPDALTRFGLAVDGAPGQLDLAKLRAAGRGGLAAEGANGRLDYEEARAALGLGDADFHLRTQPLWDPLAEAGPGPIRGLDVAYLADFTSTISGASNYPARNASRVFDGGDHLLVNLTITNNGTVPTMFQVQFHLPLARGDLEDSANTPLLAPDASWNVTLRLKKSSLWVWEDSADQRLRVKVYDPVKKVGDFAIDLAPTPLATGPALDRVALTLNPQAFTYFTNQFPKVGWESWAADGDEADAPDVNVTVRNDAGAAVAYYEGDNTAQKWQLPAKLAAGAYNVSIRLVSDPTMANNDTLVVHDGSLGQFTANPVVALTESALSKAERSLLLTLVQGFANTTYNVSSGDVYLDQLQVTDGALAANLTAGLFDVLVIGSGVDQAALAGQNAKASVQAFVEAGGLLVVLGSADQQESWLSPLLDASTASPAGVDAPDPTHPILHAPEALDHGRYLDGGRRWTLATPGEGGHFTHVLGAVAAGEAQDVLAVSRPGHFGTGNVILAAWQLGALTSPVDRDEALAALYNFLRYAAGSLYLELGPLVPQYAEVASAARVATAVNPLAPDQRVLVRVTLWTFR